VRAHLVSHGAENSFTKAKTNRNPNTNKQQLVEGLVTLLCAWFMLHFGTGLRSETVVDVD
jgi:hypothetical protein